MRDRFFVPTGMLEAGYTIPTWDPAPVAHTYWDDGYEDDGVNDHDQAA